MTFLLYFIENKFNLETIRNLLLLSPTVYDDLTKIMELINQAYNKNKIQISIEDKNNINIIIKITNGNNEIDHSIQLNKVKVDNKGKIDYILNDIKYFKQNKNLLTNAN